MRVCDLFDEEILYLFYAYLLVSGMCVHSNNDILNQAKKYYTVIGK